MPHITARDGTRLYYEEAGQGTPVVFVHEYAGGLPHLGDADAAFLPRRTAASPTASAVIRHPMFQTIRTNTARIRFSDDVIAVMDALKIDKAHIVGHSMGALHGAACRHPTSAALHFDDGRRLRLRIERGSRRSWRNTRAASRETGKMFASTDIKAAAARYADGPTRQAHKNKDPRGYAEFVQMLSEHSAHGHSLTMINLQAKRPTLWDMEADLKKFSVPLLIIVGDEDDWCVDGSVFLRRTVPTAGLMIVPRTGHTLTSEEPEKFNAALADCLPMPKRAAGSRTNHH